MCSNWKNTLLNVWQSILLGMFGPLKACSIKNTMKPEAKECRVRWEAWWEVLILSCQRAKYSNKKEHRIGWGYCLPTVQEVNSHQAKATFQSAGHLGPCMAKAWTTAESICTIQEHGIWRIKHISSKWCRKVKARVPFQYILYLLDKIFRSSHTIRASGCIWPFFQLLTLHFFIFTANEP